MHRACTCNRDITDWRQMWVSIDDWHENPECIHTKFT